MKRPLTIQQSSLPLNPRTMEPPAYRDKTLTPMNCPQLHNEYIVWQLYNSKKNNQHLHSTHSGEKGFPHSDNFNSQG